MEKKLLVEVDVPEKIPEWGKIKGATALVQSIGDLTLLVFYFLLRVYEYTLTFRGLVTVQASGSKSQTNQFRPKEIFLFKRCKLGTLRQLSPSAPHDDLFSADSSTLRLGNKKNGWKKCLHSLISKWMQLFLCNWGAR